MVRYGMVYVVNNKHKSTEAVNFVKAICNRSAIEMLFETDR